MSDQGCDPSALGQCQSAAATIQNGCGTMCQVPVNSTSMLDDLLASWQAAGCASVPGLGCSSGCPALRSAVCVAGDGGGGVCVGSD